MKRLLPSRSVSSPVVALVIIAVILAAGVVPGLSCAGGDEIGSVSPSTTAALPSDTSNVGSPAGGLTVGSATTTSGGAAANSAVTGAAVADGDEATGPITADGAKKIGANELGRIPVLMYHLIGTGKNCLTPDQLHFHIALLRSHGFNPGNILFGQADLAQRKLQNLVEWGYEIGSHGMTHMDFSKATAAQVRRELAESQAKLESLIGSGYELFTLSPPYGEYPSDASLLLSGEYKGQAYAYQAVVMAWGESSPSPFSSKFNTTRIPRITAAAPESVKKLLKYWNGHRGLLYISDGDPGTVSFPKAAPAELGTLRADLDQTVVEY